MTTQVRTLEEVRALGLAVLARELGPVDMVRFFQQFEVGQGDYTNDRQQWLDHFTVTDVERLLRERRQVEDTR